MTDQKPAKEWGIDLTGRTMWYEPWPTEENNNYRKPTDIEIEEIYAISGEAVRETLLYFEQRAALELDENLKRKYSNSYEETEELISTALNEHPSSPPHLQPTIEDKLPRNAYVKRSPSGVEGKYIIQLSVSDTGIGIPEDRLTTIFDRFNQVDGTSSRKFEGTGIGLAFAKEIVDMHGGTISVKSTEGKGSTFTIELHTSFL